MAHIGPPHKNSGRRSHAGRDADRTVVQEVSPRAGLSQAPVSAALIVIGGRSIGEMFVLDGDEISIGRAHSCRVLLDDEGVSRHHAKIVRRGGDLVFMDLGSTNGSYCDGERIVTLTLRDGMKIQVGSATVVQFKYQDEREVEFHTLMQNVRTHDPLTGVLNRRAFEEETEKEVNFAHRHGHSLSVILFDLDQLRRINEAYGHPAGDMVLRAVAKRVRDLMRREDVFARYGGEEFAVLLRATGLESAFIVAERMRRSIEATEITHGGHRIPATVSLGVATLDSKMSAVGLFNAAESHLFRAKRRGRNRTESPLFD